MNLSLVSKLEMSAEGSNVSACADALEPRVRVRVKDRGGGQDVLTQSRRRK